MWRNAGISEMMTAGSAAYAAKRERPPTPTQYVFPIEVRDSSRWREEDNGSWISGLQQK